MYAALIFFVLYEWPSGLLVGMRESDKCQRRIDTVRSPDDGHIVARNM